MSDQQVTAHCNKESLQFKPGPTSEMLKGNFLCSKEHNLMLNKILEANKWLKARKKSQLKISSLFKVFPWGLKTLRMFFVNEPLICLVCKDP